MYSLFEEELRHEEELMARFLIHQEIGHAESSSFLPLHDGYRRGQDQYLEQLAALKQSLDIPIIASLNGITTAGFPRSSRSVTSTQVSIHDVKSLVRLSSPDRSQWIRVGCTTPGCQTVSHARLGS